MASSAFLACKFNANLQSLQNNTNVTNLHKKTSDNESISDSELKRNRELWLENNVSNYNMLLEIRELDSLYSGLPHVEVQVRDSIVAEIVTIPKTDKGGILQKRYD